MREKRGTQKRERKHTRENVLVHMREIAGKYVDLSGYRLFMFYFNKCTFKAQIL